MLSLAEDGERRHLPLALDAVARSELLHERVRAFVSGEPGAFDFETLALEIAGFQAEFSPGIARLVRAHGGRPARLADVPAVPVAAFQLTRVSAHPPELDRRRFVTSGTTGARRGTHCFRTTDTYDRIALAFGERALVERSGVPRVVVSLAPVPEPSSSLGYMMALFQKTWDGRGLDDRAFDQYARERWLVDGTRVDVEGLARAAAVARGRGEPLLVLTTAFALVGLIDELGGAAIDAPRETCVMVTGGFKGRTRELEKAALYAAAARAFGVPEARVVGEYGMTELTSQLYEGRLPTSGLAGGAGGYVEPPWLRVEAVDPVSLEPLPAGEVGIARIVDLGNVDSAVAIQTEDLVRRAPGGIELLGRRAGAEARGCSLALEALLAQS